jgi:hypothetical protein
MRGEVEIWDGDKLLHKESNLLVNGAGELLADIMTVSPSLSGIADHATSSILDASNYTIQAISFGKDASAYQNNAHALNSRRNLFPVSTPSAGGHGVYHTGVDVFSTPDISPPPQFAGIASSVAHVIRIDETDTTGNGYLSYSMTVGNAVNGPNWSVSGGQDNWWCWSCYVKYPATASSVSENTLTTSPWHPRTHFGFNIYGEGRDLTVGGSGGLGFSRLGTVVNWGDTDAVIPYSPSSISLSYKDAALGGTARSEASGYSINNWQQNGGAIPVGDGWYRAWAAGLSPVSGVSSISTTLYPATYEASPAGESTASIHTFGFQMEMGRWPTELQFNLDNFHMNNWDLSGSVLNRDHSPGAVTDNGTVRVLNDPIPNPNILSYTVDPWDSPGISPGSYTAGEYWSANSTGYVASFSSILETNPFGGVSSVELSAPVITGGNWPHISLKEASAIAAAGYPVNQSRTFKKGYDNIYSTYIKKPSSNATSAFSLALQDWYNPDPEGNSVVFEFLGGGTVPTFKSTSYGYNSYLIEAVGNDWYRITLIIYGLGSGGANGDTVEGDGIVPFIMMGHHGLADPTGVSLKRLWFYAPQLEQWPTGTKLSPTKYREVSGGVPTYAEDNLLTSSYVPTNYLSSPPNPESTRVEDRDTALLDVSSDTLRNFNMGQNLNVIPWRSDPGGAWGDARDSRIYQRLLPHNVSDGENQEDLLLAYSTLNAPASGMDCFGPQAYYLGCYPEGSSTGGSNWALVSSLDNSAAYLHVANGTDPNFVSGTYNSIVNEASSMDVSGFVGKVYDAKNKVGDLPNPNLLAYTINTEDDPNLTFNSDLAGTWDSIFPGELGTFSSVLYTNPFGGPSSMILSGDAGGTNEYAGIRQRPDGSNPNLRLPLFHATSSICFSVYVKEYDNASKACSSFMVNAYDNNGDLRSYIGQYKFVASVPTLLLAPPDDVVSKVEDVGDGWYRVSIIVDGLQHSYTQENDTMQAVLYLSDLGADDEVNLRDKLLYWYAPQVEQHPTAYGITLPTPYQAVAGLTPTIAEQNGTGGLHVSGGVDATNSGTVEYSMLIGSGDVGYSNLYGGIYNMGLWTIDMDEALKVGNTPPYSFGPLNNPRKYKLFSTKHLTKNLGFIEDSGTNAGSLNYTDLTIKWRLHFL